MSLRDVERAMIVLEYFYNKMAVFKQHMDQKAQDALENEEVYICVTICLMVNKN